MKDRSRFKLGTEIIVILAVFILAISVLTKAFVLAEQRSSKAAVLSDAVSLASNCADVFLASKDDEEIYRILNESDNAEKGEDLKVFYDEDLKASKQGKFTVILHEEEKDGFITADISVFYADELIYEISTGKGGGK